MRFKCTTEISVHPIFPGYHLVICPKTIQSSLKRLGYLELRGSNNFQWRSLIPFHPQLKPLFIKKTRILNWVAIVVGHSPVMTENVSEQSLVVASVRSSDGRLQ